MPALKQWMLLFVAASLLPQVTQAWFAEGHRVTAMVAARQLTDKTRNQLRRIMGSKDLAGQLATASTYMDDHKPLLAEHYPTSKRWHFDDVPTCNNVPYAKYCPNGDCASAVIEQQIKVLKKDPSDGAKLQAVRYLVHIIGDIQQPLHAANADDFGGNRVTFPPVTANHQSYSSLHALWDGYWVALAMKAKGFTEADYADWLYSKYKDRSPAWQKGNAYDWVAESHKIATDTVYGKLPAWSCGEAGGARLPKLSAAYLAAGETVVPEQLAKAGARIAYVLNEALGQ